MPHRRTRLSVLCAMVLPTALVAVQAQTLYKSVGADGRVVYSDQPPANGAVQKAIKLDNLPVSVVPGMAVQPSGVVSATVASGNAASAQRPGDVVLYTAVWCGYCKAAKSYLGSKGIPYRELDVDTPAGKAAFAQLGVRGIPVLQANGQRLTGFTPQAYDAALKVPR